MMPPRTAESSPFLIRPAETRDAEAIAVVLRTSMREALPYLPDLHTADEDLAWVANVVLPHQEVWVAEAGGHVVGVAALDGDMLAQLYILPGEQGRGIGSALLAKAMARRPASMRLYAFQRNTRARGFYERRGFVAVEFGDGSGNEEGEPDVLYQWTPTTGDLGKEFALPGSSVVQTLCRGHPALGEQRPILVGNAVAVRGLRSG